MLRGRRPLSLPHPSLAPRAARARPRMARSLAFQTVVMVRVKGRRKKTWSQKGISLCATPRHAERLPRPGALRNRSGVARRGGRAG